MQSHAPAQEFTFKLVDGENVDVSKNVKLFGKSTYSEFDASKKKHVYRFYYPSPEELMLSPEVWTDIDFSEAYTTKAIILQRNLDEK